MKFETKTIHGVREGKKKELWGTNVNFASTFPVAEFGVTQEFEYSRVSAPTRNELEEIIAALENGKYAYAFSSGMATTTSVFTMFSAGDHIILGQDIYGGTYRILHDVYSKFGVESTFVDTTDLENIRKAIKPNTKAILIETPSNPLLDVTDIRGVVEIAKEHNLITIADNTFMTPYLQRPLDLGIDIVIHSATKFLSGHHDLLAGVAVTNNEEIAEKAKEINADVVTLSGLISPSLKEMERVADLFQKVGMQVPVLIAGAATSKLHTGLKVLPNYDYSLHVTDAMDTITVVSQLLSTKRKDFLETKQTQLRKIAKRYMDNNSDQPEEKKVLPEVKKTVSYIPKVLGKQFLKIDKWFPSSKTCSKCGNVKEELKLSERSYKCECCGIEIDRD